MVCDYRRDGAQVSIDPEQKIVNTGIDMVLSVIPMSISTTIRRGRKGDGDIVTTVTFLRDGCPVVQRTLNSRDHSVDLSAWSGEPYTPEELNRIAQLLQQIVEDRDKELEAIYSAMEPK